MGGLNAVFTHLQWRQDSTKVKILYLIYTYSLYVFKLSAIQFVLTARSELLTLAHVATHVHASLLLEQ